MALHFSAISGPFQDKEVIKTKPFGKMGGVIGRAPDCTLVLDDGERHVSRQHVGIRYTSAGFQLSVLSEVNPVKLNGQLLTHGQSHLLIEGDRLEIGPFVLKAHVILESIAPVGTATPVSTPVASNAEALLLALSQGMKFPMKFPADKKPEEFFHQVGELLAELMEGSRRMALQRAESKSEYVPADRTMMVATDINPFKHATSRQEMFKLVFSELNPDGVREATDAATDIMSDLRVHEAAMQSGMRFAMQKLLSEFDPVQLGMEEGGLLSGVFGGQKIAAYRKRHAELKEAVARGASSEVWQAFRDGYREEVRLQKGKAKN